MSYKEIVTDAKSRFEKALSHTQELLRGIRTSRASSALVDGIKVDYYGTMTPISQLASISIPEPRQILIKPFDQSVIENLSKAIMKSDLGINPDTDGKVIRLNLPPLSGDQRKKYAAKAREICEEGRVSMRNVRRDVNKQADSIQKSGEVTEDENHKLHEEIQNLLKDYEKKLDETQEKKTTEILEV